MSWIYILPISGYIQLISLVTFRWKSKLKWKIAIGSWHVFKLLSALRWNKNLFPFSTAWKILNFFLVGRGDDEYYGFSSFSHEFLWFKFYPIVLFHIRDFKCRDWTTIIYLFIFTYFSLTWFGIVKFIHYILFFVAKVLVVLVHLDWCPWLESINRKIEISDKDWLAILLLSKTVNLSR